MVKIWILNNRDKIHRFFLLGILKVAKKGGWCSPLTVDKHPSFPIQPSSQNLFWDLVHLLYRGVGIKVSNFIFLKLFLGPLFSPTIVSSHPKNRSFFSSPFFWSENGIINLGLNDQIVKPKATKPLPIPKFNLLKFFHN